MKTINLIVLALVVIYLLVAPLALGQGGNPPASTKESGATSGHGMTAVEQSGKDGGNAEQQIKQVLDQIVAAQLKVDTNALEKLLADGYTAIYANGMLFTKAGEIENFKSGAIKDEILDLHDPKTRVYGGAAVTTALISFKGTINWKPFSGDLRITRVWVKQGDMWKCAAVQATRVAPLPSQ